MYPEAGEATITHVPSGRGTTGIGREPRTTSSAIGPVVTHGIRAKGKVRRYARTNRLRFLWTLTYADEPATRAEVTVHLRWFLQQMRRLFGRLPLVVVIEEGGASGRLHVHFGAPRFLSIESVRRAWPHGIVHVGDPRKLAGRVPVRRLAAYLAKYVAKELDADELADPKGRDAGAHRYLVTQGFQPTRWRLRYVRIGAASERMRGLYGEPDAMVSFGDWQKGPIFGLWYSFPDGCLHPPPRPG